MNKRCVDWFWDRWIIGFLVLVIVALGYGSIQIVQTHNWLIAHTQYVRNRDVDWNAWMNRLDDHMNSQDREFTKIQNNQKIIVDHVKYHEKMMLESKTR